MASSSPERYRLLEEPPVIVAQDWPSIMLHVERGHTVEPNERENYPDQSIFLDEGPQVTKSLVLSIFDQELAEIKEEIGDAMAGQPEAVVAAELARYEQAARDAAAIFTEDAMRDFLTTRSDLAGVATDRAVMV